MADESRRAPRHRALAPALWALVLVVACIPARGAELSGFVASELRYFPEPPLDARQYSGTNWSLAAQPKLYHSWNDGRQSITFVPFVRLDQHDAERTHVDIRELTWLNAGDAWELRAGIGKVFWGVTEFLHLVDVINQTDLVENVDGEDKLGQPMVDLTLFSDWGTLDLFVLPYFRERTFPGTRGRLRSVPRVDTEQARYESGARRRRIDLAARWSHAIGAFDVGVYHFHGTTRDPRFVPGLDGGGNPVLVPFYEVIHQTGLDLQATTGNWLWKFEGFTRSGQGERFGALTGGFEYTFVGAFGTPANVGLVAEYLFDERGEDSLTLFEDDIYVAARVAFNDPQSTELIAGVAFDRGSDASVFNLEASRRLGDRWVLSLEARAFSRLAERDVRAGIRNDDYVQLELAFFL